MMKSQESLVTKHVLQVVPEVTYGLFAFPTLQQILGGEFLVIIEMTGLHGSLRYVVYIFMNAAFIFLP